MITRFSVLVVIVFLFIGCSPASETSDFVNDLRDGGFVIVMRHASSPGELPDEQEVNADNINGERQLDEIGRSSATAMGVSIRRLGIPITQVDSSPTYRTLETARLLGFEPVQVRAYLSNEGMQASSAAFAAGIQENLANKPVRGNRLLITHSPNVAAAFPELRPEVEQGESLVFDPDISISVPVVRVRIDEWQDM